VVREGLSLSMRAELGFEKRDAAPRRSTRTLRLDIPWECGAAARLVQVRILSPFHARER
jgi:hypothetical protein